MNNTIYYKGLDKNLNYYGFQYKLGINIITKNFNPLNNNELNGLYFTDRYNIIKYLRYYDIYIAELTIPDDAQVYRDPNEDIWKSDKFIINKYYPINEWAGWNDEKNRIRAIKNNDQMLKYISEEFKTKELCELAVNQNGNALEWVPEYLKNKELCLKAVELNNL